MSSTTNNEGDSKRASWLLKTSYCFWCGQYLLANEITKDHVIPSYLVGNDTRLVDCCNTCNQERGKLSGLASTYQIKNPRFRRKIIQEARNHKEQYINLMLKYKKLIKKKLYSDEQARCLAELNIVKNLL